jgi:hypothetical protein
MIVFLEFPLVDIRLFIKNGEVCKLKSPTWPFPDNGEFVRGFGEIQPRTKGGINGWIGESQICKASRAIRFKSHPYFFQTLDDDKINKKFKTISEQELKSFGFHKKVGIRCLSRLFYHDGCSTAKIQIVFGTMPEKVENSLFLFDQICLLIDHILSCKVTLTSPTSNALQIPNELELFSCKKYLAKLYLLSSSSSKIQESLLNENLVIAGEPTILIDCRCDDEVYLHQKIKTFSIKTSTIDDDEIQISLSRWWHNSNNKKLHIWLIKHHSSQEESLQLGRVLRIHLLRLHSEFQCLQKVLKSIELGTIRINNDLGNTESSFLQDYLNESTRRIGKIHKKISKKYKIEDIEEIAYQSIDHLSQGSRDSLLVYLEKIKLQVFRKIEKFTDKMTQHSVPCGIVNINAETVTFHERGLDMSSNSTGDTYNAPVGIGKMTDNAKVDAENIGGIVNEASKESLIEITTEVHQLLERLSVDFPTTSVVEKAIVAEKAKEQLEGNKSYQERIIEAIKLGGLAAFEKAIDHPIAAFFVEAIKSWFDKN